MVGGSSIIRFPLVIAVSEWDMPGIDSGPLGWHTTALTNGLQEVSKAKNTKMNCKHRNSHSKKMLETIQQTQQMAEQSVKAIRN